MDATNLTITLFILGCAVPFAAEAIKVTGRLRWTLGGVAAAFVVAAILWLPIAHNFPRVAAFVGPIASNPMSWFLLVFSGVAIAREWWSRTQTDKLPSTLKLKANPKPSTAPNPGEGLRLERAEREMASLGETLAGWVELVDGCRSRLDAIRQTADLAEAKADAAQTQADAAMNKAIAQGRDIQALENTVDRMLLRFTALADRERLARFDAPMAAQIQKLYFAEGQGIEDVVWDRWEAGEGNWRGMLRAWSSVARRYTDTDPFEIIKAVSPDDYLGTWSFNESDLPDGNTIIRYKTFCIMKRRFEGLRDQVEEATYAAAFG